MKKVVFILGILILFEVGACSQLRIPTDPLETGFLDTPLSTWSYVLWHWMENNYSNEGISKDLEVMKGSGIGGTPIYNIAFSVQETHDPILNSPWSGQTYRGPAYREALKHATSEAERLGLKIGLQNTAGYSTTDSMWIDEKRGMQKLVWSTTPIDRGIQILLSNLESERPNYNGYDITGQKAILYQDIAFLAILELIDFSSHSSKAINYFSETATYYKKIMIDTNILNDNQRIVWT